jgi:hypothetical protein
VPIIAISGDLPVRRGAGFLKLARSFGASVSLAKRFRASQLCTLVRQVLESET